MSNTEICLWFKSYYWILLNPVKNVEPFDVVWRLIMIFLVKTDWNFRFLMNFSYNIARFRSIRTPKCVENSRLSSSWTSSTAFIASWSTVESSSRRWTAITEAEAKRIEDKSFILKYYWIKVYGYIDVGDEYWKQFMSVASMKCTWPFWAIRDWYER